MRTETDSIGSIQLPDDAYYGVQSYRAKQNFPLSGTTMLPEMIDSLVEIKKAAAIANGLNGNLNKRLETAIQGLERSGRESGSERLNSLRLASEDIIKMRRKSHGDGS